MVGAGSSFAGRGVEAEAIAYIVVEEVYLPSSGASATDAVAGCQLLKMTPL